MTHESPLDGSAAGTGERQQRARSRAQERAARRRAATVEQGRLDAAVAGEAPWQRWGTYLSERAWGTVREDYSADGDA
ncbi:MAG: hypothetical protein ACH36H_11965, partial [Candidatus Nanopelagicales bacterium]